MKKIIQLALLALLLQGTLFLPTVLADGPQPPPTCNPLKQCIKTA